MINILLILLLLHLIFYKPSNMLACGLFGYSGSKPPNMANIKILGMYNVSRGQDSCGIYIDGTVTRKADAKNSNFIDFTENFKFKVPEKDMTIIAHTRKASSGKIDEKSSHPYSYFVDNNLSNVFVHNGTVWNWRNLLKKHFKKKKPDDFLTDSQAIGYMLANGRTKILKEYDGAITCLMHDVKKPNHLWVWKGCTEEGNECVGDRPLFYLQVDGGMYISSIRSSLESINDSDEVVTSFPTNTIIEIQDGVIINETKIDRPIEKKWSTQWTSPSKNTSNNSASNCKVSGTTNDSTSFTSDSIKDVNKFKGKVCWVGGRYWRNGHLMSGKWSLTADGTHDTDKGIEYWFHKGILLRCKKPKEFGEAVRQITSTLKKLGSNTISTSQATDNLAKLSSEPVELLRSELPGKENKGRIRIMYTDDTLARFYTGNFTTKFARTVNYVINNGEVKKKTIVEDWDNLTEEEWQDAVQTVNEEKALLELEKKPDEYWENLKWHEIDYNSMSPAIKEFYFEQAKHFKAEIYDDDTYGDGLLADYVDSEILGMLQIALDEIEVKFPAETQFKYQMRQCLESCMAYISQCNDEEIIAPWDE